MSSLMPESFSTVQDALRWTWEQKHQQLLGTRPSEIAFMWLRLNRWLKRQNYVVHAGEHTLELGDDTQWYLRRVDRLFTRHDYEAIWNLNIHPLGDELKLAIRDAWDKGVLPGGPGLMPEDSQSGEPVQQDKVQIQEDTFRRPGSTEISRWLEHWIKEGNRVSLPRCWNCRSFTMPLSGNHFCTKHSAEVDCLYHCDYWDARL